MSTATVIAVPPIFDACCTADRRCYDLDRPWIADGHLWAGDGRILVRAPADALDPAIRGAYSPRRRRLPAVRPMFLAKLDAGFGDPVELPRGIAGIETCPECSGDGLGGIRRNRSPCRVGPVTLRGDYIALLTAHGVTHVRPPSRRPAPFRAEPVYFAGPGFDGLLMPMA